MLASSFGAQHGGLLPNRFPFPNHSIVFSIHTCLCGCVVVIGLTSAVVPAKRFHGMTKTPLRELGANLK